MSEVKESGQAVGAQVLAGLSGFAPATIISQAARLQARQRLFNLVVTNVPGPQIPLYVLGREMEAIYPMVPLAQNTALGIAIMSYNGQLNFGLSADYDALTDLETLAEELAAAIQEIVEAAWTSAAGRYPPPHPSGSTAGSAHGRVSLLERALSRRVTRPLASAHRSSLRVLRLPGPRLHWPEPPPGVPITDPRMPAAPGGAASPAVSDLRAPGTSSLAYGTRSPARPLLGLAPLARRPGRPPR